MKEDDNIEDLFKDKFKDFEADVKPDVWKNVQTALKGFGLGFLIKSLINKIGTSTLIAVASSVVTVISTVMVMNWSGDKKTDIAENKPATTKAVVENTVPNTTNNIVAKEEVKPVVEPVENKNATVESNPTTKNNSVDKEEMKSVINKYSKTPVADISASPVAGELPLQVSLMNKGTGKVNKWIYGDSKQVETENSPIHFYNQAGIYTVKLFSTDADGKTSVDSTKIEVVGNPSISSAPTEFSPNGDHVLDEFAVNAPNIKDMDVVIFDAKGNIVYQWKGVDGKWNGKNINGKDAKEGIYYYIIKGVGFQGKEYGQKGSIKLTRKTLPKN